MPSAAGRHQAHVDRATAARSGRPAAGPGFRASAPSSRSATPGTVHQAAGERSASATISRNVSSPSPITSTSTAIGRGCGAARGPASRAGRTGRRTRPAAPGRPPSAALPTARRNGNDHRNAEPPTTSGSNGDHLLRHRPPAAGPVGSRSHTRTSSPGRPGRTQRRLHHPHAQVRHALRHGGIVVRIARQQRHPAPRCGRSRRHRVRSQLPVRGIRWCGNDHQKSPTCRPPAASRRVSSSRVAAGSSADQPRQERMASVRGSKPCPTPAARGSSARPAAPGSDRRARRPAATAHSPACGRTRPACRRAARR